MKAHPRSSRPTVVPLSSSSQSARDSSPLIGLILWQNERNKCQGRHMSKYLSEQKWQNLPPWPAARQSQQKNQHDEKPDPNPTAKLDLRKVVPGRSARGHMSDTAKNPERKESRSANKNMGINASSSKARTHHCRSPQLEKDPRFGSRL